MKIIKRNGEEAEFDIRKIESAIAKANADVSESARITPLMIKAIAEEVADDVEKGGHTPDVEEIQDQVIYSLGRHGAHVIAAAYTKYRYKRELVRKANTTDDEILALVDLANEEAKQENSNKDPAINSTQRDYIAGYVSRDITDRLLLPQDVVKAHNKGIIHFHDSDYFLQRMHNCDLLNLEDILQNGTVISETMIEPPKSFRTAATITSQVVAQVASNQYGGQTYTLSHLAPFVDVSRKKNRERVREMFPDMKASDVNEAAEKLTRQEVTDGVQTMAYQLMTLLTTNGQTPFVSVFMYLDEVPEGQARDDLALLIEEMLKQRILGMKNEKGVYVTPAFPKLLYVLEEDNVREGSKYWYLTKLAAECTAKRMVPDYISEKVMRELKGDTCPCMGCVDGEEVVAYRLFGKMYVESFRRMWQRISDHFEIHTQPNGRDLYADVSGMEIYDQKDGFTEVKRVIRNWSDRWVTVRFSNGRTVTCTADHPFETENRGIVYAEDLAETDVVALDFKSGTHAGEVPFNTDRAWLLGMLLCDSAYYDGITVSIAGTGEDDIEDAIKGVFKNEYGLDTKTILQDRGAKGMYKDVKVVSDGSKSFLSFKATLVSMFGGKAKADRHVPNEVFEWKADARMAFLAGMVDADGYVNDTMRLTSVQISSTNKELAIQQMLLAQTLGMPAVMYLNHYRSNCRNNIRYRVEFTPSEKFIRFIRSGKKLGHVGELGRKNDSVRSMLTGSPAEVRPLDGRTGFSYDVTTVSEHFTVSGIYSHNCRSFLTPDTEGLGENGSHKYYGRLTYRATLNGVNARKSGVHAA